MIEERSGRGLLVFSRAENIWECTQVKTVIFRLVIFGTYSGSVVV